MITDHNIQSRVLAEDINRLNKIVVLSIIRQYHEISRAEIVRYTNLSAPTVTRIVDSLINHEGLVSEIGTGESKGGRPPLMVKLNDENNYVIGIDWGRTHIQGSLANLKAETLYSLDFPVSSGNDLEKDLPKLIQLIQSLVDNSGVNKRKIKGIGLAVAGFVDVKSGNIVHSPNFGWENVNIKEYLASKIDIPIIVENVSRAMALGELWFGLGAQIKDFVFVNIGYGIGSGIIKDGKAFYGFDGFAGEIGHNRVTLLNTIKKSRKCVCGKNDCLESYVSGRGIAETVLKTIDQHKDSLIFKIIKRKGDITTKVVAQAAKAGDVYARNVLEEAAEMLGIALANLSNTLNPEAIIIGGKVVLSGEYFYQKIQTAFERETLNKVNRPVFLLRSSLMGEAAVKGAVALMLKEVLDLKTII